MGARLHVPHANTSISPAQSPRKPFQFSISTLLLVVTASGVLFGLVRWSGDNAPLLTITAPFGLGVALMAKVASDHSVWPTRLLVAASVVLVGMSAGFQDKLLVGIGVFFSFALWPPVALALSAVLPRSRNIAPRRQIVATALCIVCMLTLLTTDWPARLAFLAFRSRLDALAARVESGQNPHLPQCVGPFVIREAHTSADGIVCLWTEPCPGGNTGFVRCSPARARRFNLWSVISLSSDWQFIRED
jgi:hypothetical protein